jgi:hypothetical protein
MTRKSPATEKIFVPRASGPQSGMAGMPQSRPKANPWPMIGHRIRQMSSNYCQHRSPADEVVGQGALVGFRK